MNITKFFFLGMQLFIFCLIPSCANESYFDEPLAVQATVSINLRDLPGFDDNFFATRTKELDSMGWQYHDKRLFSRIIFPEKSVVLSNGDILALSPESRVDLRGYKSSEVKELTLMSEGVAVVFKYNDGKFVYDFDDFLKSMDGACCEGGNAKTPRCVDYNGPLGNGKNDQGTLQSVINFLGSDCDKTMALGYCWGEHSNGAGGCYKTHGGKLCTEFLK